MKTVRPNVRCNVHDQHVEFARGDRIETGRGLVEKHDLRIERERARKRDAFGHAAGQFRGKLVAIVRLKADHFEFGRRHFIAAATPTFQIFAHRKLDVLPNRQRGEQRALLEQDAPPPSDRLGFAAVVGIVEFQCPSLRSGLGVSE